MPICVMSRTLTLYPRIKNEPASVVKHRALLLSIAQCCIFRAMSRAHPQVNFRMPAELKERLETAARQNGRSTTAELIARLEASFYPEVGVASLVPASKAKELAAVAREKMGGTLQAHATAQIQKAISVGATSTLISFDNLGLEELTEEQYKRLRDAVIATLKSEGYTVNHEGLRLISVKW